MKIGDKVCFRADVLRRLMHDKTVADRRGVVLGFIAGGKVARVDFGDTFPNEDGCNIRGVPVANLSAIIEGMPPPITATEA